ncbi:MAG: hypothetical protein GX594_03825 [Pirellulaceae bacterium]|nr:hypothetical protein [Pirellulaceae bacterium]
MAKVEGENPNFDELNTSGEENAPEEPVLEDAAIEPLEPAEGAEAVAEEQPVEEPAAETEESEAEAPEKPRKRSFLIEAVLAIGLPVVFVGLFLVNIIFLSTAVYLLGMCYIPLGLWMGRRSNTVFTVFLACTLAALMTASFCLWIELRRYEFDTKAQDARVSMTLPMGIETLA